MLLTNVHRVKDVVFPVLKCRYESWIIKKVEHQSSVAFEMWCWRRLLRVPWTARWSNQSVLNEINPEYSWKDWCWSWNFNTWATWWEELTQWKIPSAGKDWRQKEKGSVEDEMVGRNHWFNGHEFGWTLRDCEGQGGLVCYSPWGLKELDMT